ncbi:aldehyde dehydrogenase family protein [Oxalobacter vibrioformis]|uniref:Aldehyde dehydrogenase family protein n=1 Tax=Oxalobacter vibrioformis TaxID=933080 RepID=A0A9E9LV75_9BURK|nr:aldehyde dehydrogenase family protein [Oxalobacter vibrioformis]NLC23895.1 aldehyde dehydrogenase family protein [Oxalobacter sp.]WAW09332.1 aldehyde dehydrogenase family protein [Oxalobacter vibrioformis]
MTTSTNIPQHELLIDGKYVKPDSGDYSTIVNPANEEVLAKVARGDAKDVDTAVKAARAALKVWNRMRAADRAQIMYKLADLMEKHQEELIMLETLNAGKPIASVRRQDMPAAIDTMRYYAGWPDKIIGQVIPARPDALTYTVREPVGVVGAIVPWNFPIMIGIWKIAPALACGCTLVVKPAELTPLTLIRIAELALEAGLPPGVLNVVTGRGSVVGDAMVAHPGVDKITFTGSPGVGRGIMQGAASNFKRITLELGGKSANVIFSDADLDSAVPAAASGVFFNAGQVCSAGSRILVQKGVYDEVVDRLIQRAKAIRIGDTAKPDTVMGPLVSSQQMKTVLDYVDIGKKEGASLVYGGGRCDMKGYFVEPTIFTGVEHEMRISQEEIFGPVASVIPFEDEADAVRIANGTAFSLAAGVWSADITRVHQVAHELRAGTVWINTYGYTDIRLPWGGTGESGFGREHGEAALENFTEPKTIWLSLLDKQKQK